jgi:hypothetical protein
MALAACAAVKKDDGAAVEARATERWDFLIKHQAEKAYDYLTPGFRQTITRQKYADQKNDPAARWKSAKVSGHSCDADSCTVTVQIGTEVRIPGLAKAQFATLPTEEHWVRSGREWYYLPDTRMKVVPVKPGEEKGTGSPGTGEPPN